MIMNGRMTIGILGMSALLIGAVTWAGSADGTVGLAKNPGRPTVNAWTTTYPSEGVTLGPVLAQPSGAESSSSVLKSFASEDVARGVLGSYLTNETPTVVYQSVTESHPIDSSITADTPFNAWVVTYPSVPAVSYGPVATPSGLSCPFIGIQDAASGRWTEFFQSCSG